MIGNVLMTGIEQMAFVIALCGLLKDEIQEKLAGKLLLVAAEVVILSIYTEFGVSGAWMLVPYMLLIVGIKYIFELSWMRSLAVYVMAFVIICSIELFYYIPFALAWGRMIENGFAGTAGSICTLVTLFLVVHLKKFNFNILFEALFKKNIAMCFTIALYSVIMLAASSYFKEHQAIPYYGYFFITALIVMLVPILILYVKAQWEIEEQRRYRKPMLDVIDRLRRQQHQYDHHLNAIYGMIQAYDTYDELAANLNRYMKEAGKTDMSYQLLFINDPVLSGFLSVKINEAEARGIEMENLVEIEQLYTNIPTSELIGVLGNLLDNAFEEAERFPEGARNVSLYAGEQNGQYVFRVTNPTRRLSVADVRLFFKKGYTTKGNAGNHGYGLYGVSKIVNKYQGKILTETYAEGNRYWINMEIHTKKA